MEMIKNEDRTVNVAITCRLCGTTYVLKVRPEDVDAYNDGAHVQDAFPYLKPGDRELFVSRTCDRCWDKMFGALDKRFESEDNEEESNGEEKGK